MDSECIEVYEPPESGRRLWDSPDKELSETVAGVVETPKWIVLRKRNCNSATWRWYTASSQGWCCVDNPSNNLTS